MLLYLDLTAATDHFIQDVAITPTKQAALLMRSKFEQTKPEADAELDLSPREVWYRNNDQANFESETYASTLMRVITPREILGCFPKVPTCVQNWPRLNVFYFYYEMTADLYWKCVH